MKLFDDIKRTQKGPAKETQGTFSFYNKSCSPAAQKVRVLLETWFAEYPDNKKELFATRFREKNKFDPGFFELFTFVLLRKCFENVEVEPEINGLTPDFSVQDRALLVESTISTEMNKKEAGKENIKNEIIEKINGIDLSRFFIWLSKVNIPKHKTPKISKIKKIIERKANSLDYKKSLDKFLNNQKMECFRYPEEANEDELIIEFCFFPKIDGKYEYHRAVGAYPVSKHCGGSEDAISNKIRGKVRKYNILDIPQVVFINVLSWWGWNDDIDILTALYGTGAKELILDLETKREFSDAVWVGPDGVRNRKLVAVVAGSITESNIPEATIRLYINPWTNYNVDLSKFLVPKFNPRKGKIIDSNLTIGGLFELPNDWPGKLFGY
jgi:hypothetical protein